MDPSGYSIAIDNLTLQNGVSSHDGGAIYPGLGSVTVTSSKFTGCSASNSGGMGFGGAIYAGSVTVTSSTFTGCSASSSGGGSTAYGYGGAISAGSVTVTSSQFTGCSASGGASGSGGAISAGSVTVTSGTVTGCSAEAAARVAKAGRSRGSVTITSSTFTGCSAGGSVYSNGGAICPAAAALSISARFYHDTLRRTVYAQGGFPMHRTTGGAQAAARCLPISMAG